MDVAPWLEDAWYPLVMSKELGARKPVAARLLGEALVLYRDARGEPQAALDRCPHRATPLSRGKVVRGELECPYHGWRFGAQGQCTRIPTLAADAAIPRAAHARALPSAERDGLVWVWWGDPEAADPEAIERHAELSDPTWRSIDMRFDYELDHRLLIENLLDPSHLPFTHDGTLSRRRDAQPLEMTVEPLENGFRGRAQRTRGARTSAGIFTFRGPCSVRLDLSSERAGFVQIHHCVPLSVDPERPRVRLFSRMVRDRFTRFPGAALLTNLGSRVILWQDLAMLRGQQRRLREGGKAWGCPVDADRISLSYRRWCDDEAKRREADR